LRNYEEIICFAKLSNDNNKMKSYLNCFYKPYSIILIMQKIKPLKRFGQNYLHDQNILNKIVNEINPKEDDCLIEIGPGFGALTEKLVARNPNLIAVEIDKRVIEELKSRFPSINLIQKDFLELDLNEIDKSNKQRLRIAGNIPYNLTSPIIFKLIAHHKIVKDAVLMVQYEVAKRMTAKQGSKDYGILAVLLNFFCDVELCFKVSPNVFYPRPKVHSAVVHIIFKRMEISEEEKKTFISIVKAAFGNRRKTLKNSLSNSIFANINFTDSGIDLSLRAEQLGTDDFIKLAKFVHK